MSHLILLLITTPWLYVAALVALGIFIGHRAMRAAVALWILAALLLIQTSSWTFSLLAGPLISDANQLEINSECLDAFPLVVVLGGGLAGNDKLSDATSERIERAAAFLHEKSAKSVVISGGPTLPGQPVTEAGLGERDLRRDLMVLNAGSVGPDPRLAPEPKIYREERSLTTYENAMRTLELVDTLQLGHKAILVTNVFHMPRAAAVFASQGFEVCALPSYPPNLRLASPFAFANTIPIAMLVHEYLGYWYYRHKGWIHEK